MVTSMSIPPDSPPLATASLSVAGRYFLITGGTQGLGLAIATQLLLLGASGLVLVSRSVDKGKSAVEQLQSMSSSSSLSTCRVVHVPTDLSIASETEALFDRALLALRQTGAEKNLMISGVVNSAATTQRGNLLTTTADAFDYQFATNVRAPFLITQALLRHILARRQSTATQSKRSRTWTNISIVNISSCASHGGAPFIMGYSASKAALVNLTKNNAAELAPYGIRVNAINLGWCYTDNEDALQTAQAGGDPSWIDRADASVPQRRIMRPTDPAVMACFLLSEASTMTTASVIDLHPDFAHGMISVEDTDAR